MAATSGDGGAAGPSYGIVLWIEWPEGKWNALLQASKSPFKGDIKIDPFRGKAQEGDASPAHTACRLLSEETSHLFHLDPSLLPSSPLPGGDIFHLKVPFSSSSSSLLLQFCSLFHDNCVTLQQDTNLKGISFVHVPLAAPKSFQPTKIRVTPQGISFSFFLFFFLLSPLFFIFFYLFLFFPFFPFLSIYLFSFLTLFFFFSLFFFFFFFC